MDSIFENHVAEAAEDDFEFEDVNINILEKVFYTNKGNKEAA